MSAWLFEDRDGTHGPVSFRSLAQLLADGAISDSSRVRDAGNKTWLLAYEVPGLEATARRLRKDQTTESKHSSGRRPSVVTRQRANPEAANMPQTKEVSAPLWNARRFAAVGLVIAGFCVVVWFAGSESRRFPVPSHAAAPQPWFPIVGNVSRVEFSLLCLDATLVGGFLAWKLLRRL